MNVNSMKTKQYNLISFFLLLLLIAGFAFTPLTLTMQGGVTVSETEARFGSGGVEAMKAEAEAEAAAAGEGEGDPTGDACDWMCTAGRWMGNLLLTAGGLVTWLGGTLLKEAIQYTITDMGKNLTQGGLGLQINELWGVVRDICNLVFIFGFVYIGIMTILNPGKTDTKRFLAQLVISALLINFSLFFVKIIVDVTNVLAIEVHQLMGGEGGDISAALTREMGISSFYTTLPPKDLNEVSGGGSIAFYIAGFFFLVIAGIVFAVGAIMLIVRFIVIIFLMIFSPFMIAGFVFPGTKKAAQELWDRLIGYSLYPAVFLFLVYISLKMLQSSAIVPGTDLSTMIRKGDTVAENMSAILVFVIAIGFLIAAMQIAQRFSSYMGGRAVGIEKWARGAIGGSIAGFAGRNAIGRPANWLSEKQDEMRKSNSLLGRSVALGMRTAGIDAVAKRGASAKFGSGSSFSDEHKIQKEVDRARSRNSEIGAISDSISAGVKAGAGSSEEIAMIQAINGASGDQLLSVLKEHKPDSAEYLAVAKHMSASQYEKVMGEKEENFDDGKKQKLKKARIDSIKSKVTPASGVDKLSTSDLEALGIEYILDNADKLTASQMDDIKKSKTLQPGFGVINSKREAAIITKFRANPGSVFTGIKDEDAAKLPKKGVFLDAAGANFNATVLPHLTPGILKQMEKNFTTAERNIIKAGIAAGGAAGASLRIWLASPRGQEF